MPQPSFEKPRKIQFGRDRCIDLLGERRTQAGPLCAIVGRKPGEVGPCAQAKLDLALAFRPQAPIDIGMQLMFGNCSFRYRHSVLRPAIAVSTARCDGRSNLLAD
jgi:hypothetical protein